MTEPVELIGKDEGRGRPVTTYTGHAFFPLDPKPEEVCIRTIAQALSNLCRFNGHTKRFYSVAQHSVLVSLNVPPRYAKEALLHDAAEAYVGDMVRPMKAMIPQFNEIDKRVDSCIRERFGLPPKMSEEVRQADNVACATEKRDLLNDPLFDWGFMPDPWPVVIKPVSPNNAYHMFMDRYEEVKND